MHRLQHGDSSNENTSELQRQILTTASVSSTAKEANLFAKEVRLEDTNGPNINSSFKGIVEHHYNNNGDVVINNVEIIREDFPSSQSCQAEFRSTNVSHNLTRETTSLRPTPKLADIILVLLAPEEDLDSSWGDMKQRYAKWAVERGLFIAKVSYYRDAFSMIRPRLEKWAIKIATLVGLGKVVRYFFS